MADGTLSLLFRPLTAALDAGTVPSKRLETHFPSRTCYPLFLGNSATAAVIRKSRRISRPIKATARQSSQNDGSDNGNRFEATSLGKLSNLTKSFLNLAANNFLPLALVSGVTLGLSNPSLGCLADKFYISKFSPCAIFYISGLTLRTEEIGAAVGAWPVGIFGLGSILFITPVFSRLILQLKLQPQEFVTGLAIFSCMPTTLSSGVALTQLAGGNSALALAMTVTSNLLGILIVPYSISKFIAGGFVETIGTKQLFKSLVVTLLVPLILGKLCRESIKGLADVVDRKRRVLSRISALCLSLVPWIQVSKSRSLLLMVKPGVFLVAVGMGMLLHLILLAFNALAVKSLSVVCGGSKSVFSEKRNASALVLVASQKTLPVMVAVVDQLGGAFGEPSLLVLPCVAAHLNQIIIDSFVVNLWRQKD